jgi:PmbA protein
VSAEAPSGRMPVVFTAKAADLLWSTVQSALNGKRVLERSTPWSESIGQPVVSRLISLAQDPTVGPYSCPFDDEGVLTQRLGLLEQGVLRGFYCDRKIGHQLGGGSTGNGFRPGLGSYPVPSLLNCVVAPGHRTLTEILAGLDQAIVIDQVLGGDAGISGELSVNVELGYWVNRGELVGRVKDTMVAGNVYTALKQVIELANDGVWNGACYTPSIVLDGLSVTGRGVD